MSCTKSGSAYVVWTNRVRVCVCVCVSNVVVYRPDCAITAELRLQPCGKELLGQQYVCVCACVCACALPEKNLLILKILPSSNRVSSYDVSLPYLTLLCVVTGLMLLVCEGNLQSLVLIMHIVQYSTVQYSLV